jgi:hypothetical protein
MVDHGGSYLKYGLRAGLGGWGGIVRGLKWFFVGVLKDLNFRRYIE